VALLAQPLGEKEAKGQVIAVNPGVIKDLAVEDE
jgi:hypothetical protein